MGNRHEHREFQRNFSQLLVKALKWIGASLIYFVVFSLLFDTPAEYKLRHSTDVLRAQYKILESRCDSLEQVLENVSDRDKNIFEILFESKPYDLNAEYEEERLALHKSLLENSNHQLIRKIEQKEREMEQKMKLLSKSYDELNSKFLSLKEKSDNIPSIQPIYNPKLTLFTASYGMLMHPFYRTLQSHQGIDYSIAEGTRIFATADGLVREVTKGSSTQGKTLTIDHLNGYTTTYSHLLAAKVRKGEKVKRGDIIALSGNTGLSLAPHLHYEVRKDGIRVDPTHYFFMELTPDEYQSIMKIARTGMQSFD
ncbi:MAG: peptidoglycan DD-metalloendopeptidase family protein [Alistipes sp.]|nr:peptidoglycan DD-metalloendopeptidase family protein [Candidatus Alistipes equi]